ncbi:response regulator [Psychrosphaera aquimarina]|uniref:Response regulator n=1 Tax=Psychrosphaera aquimarina TaxID=2044854 RepID=A0ABU3QYI2_9GAMM|nr:response regulator [Psychrosphaera aquimarina]MDU0112500.1 response regulator [Psychrosphaera aquimarina]
MSSKEVVFIIEDDRNYIEIYEQVLCSEYQIVAFNSALAALEKFKELDPKTILLDLNLPEMNGIEFCRKLFSEYCSNTDVDIIFVSGESDPKMKFSAFEEGAVDYLTKPFEIKELVYKVNGSIQRRLKEEHLVSDALENKQLIYTTMAQASQYSQVMSFLKT